MKLVWPFILMIMLASCATSPGPYLPPVIDNTSQSTEPGSGVQTYPLPQAEVVEAVPLSEPQALPDSGYYPPAVSGTQTNSTAVVALLDQADQHSTTGDPDAAAAALERALRIEPRNAALWSKLAAIRLQQGEADQAEQLALKSNTLSINDNRLLIQNWRIIARARWARDDKAGARSAEQKVKNLEMRL